MAMICPDCGNMIAYNSYFSAFYCPRCGGFFKKVKPMTNADRIRSMSDDELNELFHDIYNAGEEDAVAYEWGQRTNSFEWTMDWLQQPAEEG